jgi:drug/metabolite transporter (DMT)-like permease
MSKRGWILFLAMGVIWGVPYLFIRVAVASIDPVVVAFGRTLIGAALLLPIAARRDLLAPTLRHWRWLLVFTLIEISVPWLMLGHAETRLNSSTTGLLLAVIPLIAAVLVTKLGHDRLDARRMTGLAVGLAGVAALVGLDIDLSDLAAVGAVAITALGYATGPIIIDRRLKDVPPLGVVAASLLLAALLYAPFAWMQWPAQAPWTAWASVATLGVLCTALAFVLFFALIAEVGPARATVITYINPVVAIALGIALLHEPFTLGMAIGFPLVIAGSIMGTARAQRPPA